MCRDYVFMILLCQKYLLCVTDELLFEKVNDEVWLAIYGMVIASPNSFLGEEFLLITANYWSLYLTS